MSSGHTQDREREADAWRRASIAERLKKYDKGLLSATITCVPEGYSTTVLLGRGSEATTVYTLFCNSEFHSVSAIIADLSSAGVTNVKDMTHDKHDTNE